MITRTAHFDFRQSSSITINVIDGDQEREIFISESADTVGQTLIHTFQELGYETTVQ